jgi:hypothetical protein
MAKLAEVAHEPETGEIHEPVQESVSTPAADPENSSAPTGLEYGAEEPLSFEDMAKEAASHGEAVFKAFYKGRSDAEKIALNKMGDQLRELMTGATG